MSSTCTDCDGTQGMELIQSCSDMPCGRLKVPQLPEGLCWLVIGTDLHRTGLQNPKEEGHQWIAQSIDMTAGDGGTGSQAKWSSGGVLTIRALRFEMKSLVA